MILPLNTKSTALSKNNPVNINWLSLAFLLSIWEIELDFHLKMNIHFKLSVATGKHVTTRFGLCNILMLCEGQLAAIEAWDVFVNNCVVSPYKLG